MSNTFKMVTLVGTSPESYEVAIENALADASASLRNLSWFEVKELRGRVVEGRPAEFQVKLQVGFKVEVS
jgi:flavin-binding protein dodecin